jgi:hypothetical protein
MKAVNRRAEVQTQMFVGERSLRAIVCWSKEMLMIPLPEDKNH